MIKKHQKLLIHANYQGTSSKQLRKKTFEPTKENQNIEENLQVLIIKLLTLNYWFNQMEKLIAAVKIQKQPPGGAL